MVDKVALVTGGARGIGAATVRLLVEKGCDVALLDLPDSQGHQLAEELTERGSNCLFVSADVREEEQVRQAVSRVRQELGNISTLINIAGTNRKGRIESLSADDWDQVMEVNVKGMFLTTKYTVPSLREAGGGSIVNLSSVSAYIGADGYAAYHTSKGAVLSLTRALALELAPDNIRVNAVCAGWVDTPFSDYVFDNSEDPDGMRKQAHAAQVLGRMATPEDIARAILFLVSGESAFVTGAPLFVDGGFMIKK